MRQGVPVERHAWQEMWWVWHAAAAVAAGATAVLLVLDADWPGLGVLLALAGWYAATGGRAMSRPERGPLGIAYVVLAVPLVLVVCALTPSGSFLLFVFFPQIWRLLPQRGAVAATVVGVLGCGVLLMGPQLSGPDGLLAGAWLGVLVLVSVLLGLWITRIIRQSAERAELLAELERTRSELAAASHDLGVLNERERMAGEIHDTLAQGLTSILLLAQAMEPTDPRAARVEEIARDNLAEARALVAALGPADLDGATLPAALQRLVERVGGELGIAAEMRVEGAERALPVGHEIVLMRVSQEAVANVRKHAGASRLELVLAFDPAATVVRISDDGRGFDPAATGGRVGFGLAGMRERVREFGGALDLRSAPGGGTCVEVRL
jgi:signal transduction histidine kinase